MTQSLNQTAVNQSPPNEDASAQDHVIAEHSSRTSSAAKNVTPVGGDLRSLTPQLRRFITLVLFTSLIILPLFFGGVHPGTYLTERILILCGLLLFLRYGSDRLFSTFAPGSSARLLFLCMCAVFGYMALQTAFLSMLHVPHPVLGTSPRLPSINAALEGLMSFFTFIALFVVARAWLGNLDFKAFALSRFILCAGLIVSLTALSHWFYDNGKLFWIFEPEHVFSSFRARWPFVNANHLGHFLLLIAFLTLGEIKCAASDLYYTFLSTHRANKRTWGLLLQSTRIQNQLIRMALLSLLLISSAVAILGSLSRGAWIGSAVGIFCFLIGSRLLSVRTASPLPNDIHLNDPAEDSSDISDGGTWNRTSRRSRSRRKTRTRRQTSLSSEQFHQIMERISRFGSTASLIVGAALIYFFLYGRGSELFFERLQYGLLYSFDDMRWQLYGDTWPILTQHWLTGVGLGGWAHFHPQYMQPLMSGVDPVFLHSDPYQFLVELGLPGALFALSALILVSTKTVRALVELRSQLHSQVSDSVPAARSRRYTSNMLLALACGLLGVFIASFVDFPFRIPAIVSLVAVVLALLSFYLDKQRLHNQRDLELPETFRVIQ